MVCFCCNFNVVEVVVVTSMLLGVYGWLFWSEFRWSDCVGKGDLVRVNVDGWLCEWIDHNFWIKK